MTSSSRPGHAARQTKPQRTGRPAAGRRHRHSGKPASRPHANTAATNTTAKPRHGAMRHPPRPWATEAPAAPPTTARKNATTQPASDNNSNTRPRQPINNARPATARNTQSSAAIAIHPEPVACYNASTEADRPALLTRPKALSASARLEWPQTHARALAVLGVHHLGVGLEARAFQLPRTSRALSASKGAHLDDERPRSAGAGACAGCWPRPSLQGLGAGASSSAHAGLGVRLGFGFFAPPWARVWPGWQPRWFGRGAGFSSVLAAGFGLSTCAAGSARPLVPITLASSQRANPRPPAAVARPVGSLAPLPTRPAGRPCCGSGMSMATSTATGRGWVSKTSGKPTTPSQHQHGRADQAIARPAAHVVDALGLCARASAVRPVAVGLRLGTARPTKLENAMECGLVRRPDAACSRGTPF